MFVNQTTQDRTGLDISIAAHKKSPCCRHADDAFRSDLGPQTISLSLSVCSSLRKLFPAITFWVLPTPGLDPETERIIMGRAVKYAGRIS